MGEPGLGGGGAEPQPPRVALALAGGGPLGGIYEVGALRALDEVLEGFEPAQLDGYVGVSAGALVAACLANGLSTAELCSMLVSGRSGLRALAPGIFFRPAYRAYLDAVWRAPALFAGGVADWLRHPLSLGVAESLARVSRAVPGGVFDNSAVQRYLRELFRVRGRSDDFRRLRRPLYVVAVDLDRGEAVRFGAEGYDHVPISRAVQASIALPGLYLPVEIDGRHYVDGALIKTVHASVALDAGAELVVCINPLVPYAGDEARAGETRLMARGLPAVMGQTFRALIHSRMQVGMGKYASEYPGRDVVLFEPGRDDSRMFFANVFSFANRKHVCEHAYQATRRQLRERADELDPLFARHGIRLRRDLLEQAGTSLPSRESLSPATRRPYHYRNAVTNRLSDTLDQLEETLDER